MSYQVLARKYRPQTFEEVVGQKPIVTTLQNAVEGDRIHHAYLFSGLRGVGKTTVARLMAKALNCAKGPSGKPCNECSSCSEIATSRSFDVLEIDGASNRGIENIRELRETVRYAPARDRHKIYIIDEVHMLTPEAWNALLKTLEEPPARVVFLFATTDYRKIPLTIMSRCQHFEFRKISPAEIRTDLERIAKGEDVTVDTGALDLIARMAEGSLRDAQSALDQVIAFSGRSITEEQARTILGVIDRELIVDFYAGVRERNCDRLIGIIETVFDRGYQPVQYLEDLMAYGRDLLLSRVLSDPGRHIAGNRAEVTSIVETAGRFQEDDLLRILELMTREEVRLRNSTNPRFLLEALAIKLARLADLKPIEEILGRLDSVKPGGPDAGPGLPGRRKGAVPAGGRSESAPAPRPTASAGPAAETAPAAVGVPGDPHASATVSAAAPATGGSARAPVAVGDQAMIETFLGRVHEERGALGGFLGQASWIEIVDDALTIAFHEKHSFFRERVETRDAIAYLKALISELAGKPLRIEVKSVAPAAIDTAIVSTEDAEASRKRRLREEAMKEPAVQTLLETFGGEIIDVESV